MNHTVGRILDRIGLPHDLVKEWQGTREAGARRRDEEDEELQLSPGRNSTPLRIPSTTSFWSIPRIGRSVPD